MKWLRRWRQARRARQTAKLMAPFHAYVDELNTTLALQGVSPEVRQRVVGEWWKTVRESFREPR